MVRVEQEGAVLKVERVNETRLANQQHGLSRSLVSNMVVGVSTGFTKTLSMIGVGYKAAVAGSNLNLSLGYSHPIEMPVPSGLEVKVEKNTTITVSGFDKELVGQFAADVRSKREPEPYKGKGVRYSDEVVRRKEGKRGK
jgi:large subunit ribosomal protein L6